MITAIATWIIPSGTYESNEDGAPSRHLPGGRSTPQRIVVDSLNAPINGLYGIEDPATGNVSFLNNGELFGAIDVALFIIVIGGFLGVTMKTGAINAGIARVVGG